MNSFVCDWSRRSVPAFRWDKKRGEEEEEEEGRKRADDARSKKREKKKRKGKEKGSAIYREKNLVRSDS